MRVLSKMVIKNFLPIFILSMLFFIFMLQLMDIFSNITRYLNNQVPFGSILKVAFLYLPKCISYSLPVAILFSISFTLGTLYANNEFIAILNAGISLYRFVLPFIFIGLFLSLFNFYFDNWVVVDSLKAKNELSDNLVQISEQNYSQSQVARIVGDDNIIYFANYYNDITKVLSNLIIIERDEEGSLEQRIDALSARWDEERNIWLMQNVTIYEYISREEGFRISTQASMDEERYNADPATFREYSRNIDEMKPEEAKEFIDFRRRSGIPYKGYLTSYYSKFSFSLTPFIVTILSCAVGTRFRKNVLVLSLVFSLVLTVAYYIFVQVVMRPMAEYGSVPPFYAAWLGFILFTILGGVLFKTAPT